MCINQEFFLTRPSGPGSKRKLRSHLDPASGILRLRHPVTIRCAREAKPALLAGGSRSRGRRRDADARAAAF
jgi:hypothetical protein